MSHERANRYSLGGFVVDVDIPDADAARWLSEFLAPAFGAASGGTPATTVRFVVSAEQHAALKGQVGEWTTTTPCFALDRKVAALPSAIDGPALVVADPFVDCFYRVERHRIDVIAAPPARPARIGLLRIVRELLVAMNQKAADVLDLHAAAFEVRGRAVLIAGTKYSGKTTLLCHALSSGIARLMANDRVFVETGRSPAVVRGVPTLVSIRPRTLELFPALGQSPRPLYALESEAPDPSESNDAALGNALALPLPRLAARLGATCAGPAPAGAVIFPEIASDADGVTLDRIDEADGLSLLFEHLYGRHRGTTRRTIFEQMYDSAPGTPDRRAAAIAFRGTRYFRCRLGPRAYDGSAAAWIAALGLM